MAASPLDRLRLTESRIDAMAAGLRTVAALADPVGEVLDGNRRPNGLLIERVRVPLGVVAIIYENRPNVTSDAFGLCVKSANAAILRGSATALRSNVAIGAIARDALTDAGLPADALIVVDDPSHETAVAVMQLDGYVDALHPARRSCAHPLDASSTPRCPVILDGDGNCHVYVDEHADLDMALAIVVNAKTQRTQRVQRGRVARGARRRSPTRFVPRVATRSSPRASSSSATRRPAGSARTSPPPPTTTSAASSSTSS